MDHLKKMINPETGNEFYLIGHDSDFHIGMRIYLINANPKETTIGFRLRIEALPSEVQPLSVQHMVAHKFPGVKLTGGSAIHASTTGKVVVPCGPFDIKSVIACMEANGAEAAIYHHVVEMFQNVQFISIEDFMGLVDQEVSAALSSFHNQFPKAEVTSITSASSGSHVPPAVGGKVSAGSLALVTSPSKGNPATGTQATVAYPGGGLVGGGGMDVVKD